MRLHFKIINDSVGHQIGNAVLCNVARRLETCVRRTDNIGRMGGDEFTVLLDGGVRVTDAVRTADAILEALRAPFLIDGYRFFVSASIGLAFSHGGEHSAEDLLRFADLAMYKAKEKGKLCYEVFDEEMEREAKERLELERDLREAIKRGEFRLYYQPIVALQTGALAGVEALVRWHHPRKGVIEPSQFIPLAERTGIIIPLGQWVIEEACRQLGVWGARIPRNALLDLHINVSARQLQQADVIEHVRRALAASALVGGQLTIEITESVLMENLESSMELTRAKKELGIRVSIDDFGTGYSSLSYLKDLPIDSLKIDRSFVQHLCNEDVNGSIVRAILALARGLKLTVIAEGIESRAELDALRFMGCERGQGYLFGKPMPPEAIDLILAAEAAAEGLDEGRFQSALLPARAGVSAR